MVRGRVVRLVKSNSGQKSKESSSKGWCAVIRPRFEVELFDKTFMNGLIGVLLCEQKNIHNRRKIIRELIETYTREREETKAGNATIKER